MFNNSHYVNSKTCQALIKVFQPNVIINKFWQNLDTNPWKETSSPAHIQLGEKTSQTLYQTFAPDIPVILHLPALTGTTIDTDTLPTLYVIQEGINCMPTTDYFFTSIKPEPIVVTHHRENHTKLTVQQAATQDPVSQQTHPLWPGETRVYPSMLADKQVPVLNLTESDIT